MRGSIPTGILSACEAQYTAPARMASGDRYAAHKGRRDVPTAHP